MPLSEHSMETYPETSSHATCQETFGHSRLSPLWTDPDIRSAISVRELIPTSKLRIIKAQAGNKWSSILPKILACEEKAPTKKSTRGEVHHLFSSVSCPSVSTFSKIFFVLFLPPVLICLVLHDTVKHFLTLWMNVVSTAAADKLL